MDMPPESKRRPTTERERHQKVLVCWYAPQFNEENLFRNHYNPVQSFARETN